VSTAAQSLANAFELMIEAYNNKKELQHLSKQLGHPLSDE
jgi:hypothetical protein